MLTNFINNFTLLFTATFLYSYIISRLPKDSLPRQILTGLIFGVVTIVGMSVPYVFTPGIIFDQRSVMLTLVGAFAGPLATVITAVITAIYRIIIGGAGVITGVLTTAASAGIGLVFYMLITQGRIKVNFLSLTILGVITHIILLALMLTLPGDAGIKIITTMGPAIMLIFTFSTVVTGLVLKDMEIRQGQNERVLQSEKKYRFLFESMTQGVTYQNSRGEITSSNPAAKRILGLSQDEILDKTSHDTGWRATKENGEDFPGDEQPGMAALRKGKPVKDTIMGIYNPSERSKRWIKIDAIPQFREGDVLPYQVFTIFEDITPLKNNEQLIKAALVRVEKNEALLKEAERIAKIGAWEYDVESGHIEWSEGVFTVYEVSTGVVPFLDEIIQFCKEEYRNELIKAMEMCLSENKAFELELQIITGRQNEKWIKAIGNGFADNTGKVVRVRGIVQDLTEAKLAALQMEESERRYRLLADNIKDVIVLLDEKLCYSYVSPSVAAVRGYSGSELMGTSYIDYVHRDDKERVQTWLDRVLQGTSDEISQMYRIDRKSGGYIWVEVKTQPIVDEKSGRARLVLSKREITARIDAMNKLRESERRYKTLFEHQPNIIWEEDFSAVKARIEVLQKEGVTNLGEYLKNNKDELGNLASLVEVIQINNATMYILEASSKDEVARKLPYYFDTPEAWDIFRNEMHVLSTGRKVFEAEIPIRTIKGGRKILDLKLIIPDEYKDTWRRVLVSFTDVTEIKRYISELHASEEKFKNYFRNSTEGIYVGEFDQPIDTSLPDEEQADLMYRYSYIADCNDAFAKIYGLTSASEAIGMRQTEAHGTETNAANREFLRKLARSQYSVKNVLTEERDIHGNLMYISNNTVGEIKDGKLVRIWASQLDVTERVLAEQRLQQSEEKYRTLVETSHDLIWTIDEKGVITFINNASKNIYGYEPEELIGKPFLAVIPMEQQQEYINNVTELMNSPHDYKQMEGEYKRKDGSTVHLLSNYRILRDETGRFAGMSGSSKDITDSVVIRERLLANQVLLENAQKIAKLGYWQLDLEKNKLFWSEEVYKIFEIEKSKKVEGYEDFFERVHPDDRAEMEEAQTKALTGKEKLNFIHRILLPDGRIKYVHERGELQYSKNFTPIRLSGTVQDITELKLIEEELRSKAIEIEESRRQIRALAMYQNEVREEERKSIAREIHDEIGQILTSVKLHLGLLDKKISGNGVTPGPDELRKELQGLMHKMDESVKMVRVIIKTLRPEFLDSLGLIAALEYHIEEFRERSGIACSFLHNLGGIPIPDALSTELFRITQESLTNISRHAQADTAMVELTRKTNSVYLRIIDNGIGMNADELSTGTFGLLGIRERTESLGGKFILTSSPGEGTIIEVEIPQQEQNRQ